MALILRYVARSDVGLVRQGNEDSGYAGPRLLAVADGMGGHAAGEVASSATIDELLHIEDGASGADATRTLSDAVVAANDRIRALVTADPDREGMGTTLTALLWTGEDIRLAHIGDSRAYLLRDGELRQITHDHTFVQALIDEGRLTEDQAESHPARSLILKALDGKPNPQPDIETLGVAPGDRFLVCSDGLSGVVSHETLTETLSGDNDITAAADALVELALRGGAPDNVTVVIGDVIETETPPAPDDTAEAFLVGAASDEPPLRVTSTRSRMWRRSAGPEALNDPEAMRYAPQPPRRFRWLRRLALVAVVVVAMWAGASLASDWIRDQYYVGDQTGEVAIFRGVSQEIGPIRLSEFESLAGDLPVAALPAVYRDRVESTIVADSFVEAQAIVDDLRRQACRAHPAPVVPESQAQTQQPEDENNADSAAEGDAATGAEDPNADADAQAHTAVTSSYPGLDCPEDP